MPLTKNDLSQIKEIVQETVQESETRVKTKLREEIQESENRVTSELREEIQESQNRVISILSREITDLSTINHAVINRLDKIDELEKRIIRLETKAGLAKIS